MACVGSGVNKVTDDFGDDIEVCRDITRQL